MARGKPSHQDAAAAAAAGASAAPAPAGAGAAVAAAGAAYAEEVLQAAAVAASTMRLEELVKGGLF